MSLEQINRFDIGEEVFYTKGNKVKKGLVWGKHFGDEYRRSTDIVTYLMDDGVKVNCHCLFSTKSEAISSLVDTISQNE